MIEKCLAGASVVDLCEMGDRLILEETSKVYKKEKEMKKGIKVPIVLLVYTHIDRWRNYFCILGMSIM